MTMTGRIARFCARRAGAVLAIWAVALLAAGVAAASIGDVLTTQFKQLNEPESQRANRLIEGRLRGPQQITEIIIVRSDTKTIDDESFRRFVADLTGQIRNLEPSVTTVTSYIETSEEALVSRDRRATLLPVNLAGNVEDAAENVAPIVELAKKASDEPGFEVLTAGRGSIDRTHNELSERDAQRGEMIGIPVALVILLLVFGTGVAAGVPLVLAVASIVIAMGVSAILGRTFELNFLIVNIITMLGLAVGVDYALFIIQRYREERRRGRENVDAIGRAGATSGRAVLFSGATVIVGLLGMLIVPSNVYRSLAAGAIAVAAAAVVASMTLLPAILRLLGNHLDALRLPFLGRSPSRQSGGFWDAVTRVVMAHPLLSVAISAAILISAAVPYFSIRPGLAGVSALPQGTDSRRAFEILDQEFSGGLIAPAEIAIVAGDVRATDVQRAVERLRVALSSDSAFGSFIVERNNAGDLALASVVLRGDPQANEAHEAIRRLRDEHIPTAFAGVDADVLVTGQTATEDDQIETIGTYTPYVFAFVLGLTFVLLLVVFRSIVVPLKAIVMNLLSVGASYGLLVLVFQRGVGNELFGFQRTDTIEAWLPLFLFSIVFGLSMDYHVFLLSRIRERFDETGDNADSVAHGVRTTAGLITGAALIMVAVFAGFALGDLSPLEQVGFGLAVAVILDATIVRSVLVPASMGLLGDLNWYLPRWLRWLPEVGGDHL